MNVNFDQLQRSPQLALLAAIDHSLVLAGHALVVAHPELVEDVAPRDEVPEDLLARHLAQAISELRQLLARYHAVIGDDLHLEIDDDIPF
jgi:hypothetical protein